MRVLSWRDRRNVYFRIENDDDDDDDDDVPWRV